MLKEIISIVRDAGELVLAARDVSARTHEKTSAADLVTEYDVAVENFLREKLLALLPEARRVRWRGRRCLLSGGAAYGPATK